MLVLYLNKLRNILNLLLHKYKGVIIAFAGVCGLFIINKKVLLGAIVIIEINRYFI